MSSDVRISLEKVNFSYRDLVIFDNFDLEVCGDQFIALIGSNGCGKSTLLKLLTGRLHAANGHIKVLGRPPGAFASKYQVGSAFQDIDFPATERVEEVLAFVCKQYPEAESVESLIKDFSLTEFRHKPCGQLSGGMKRRLALACAFAGRPKILLLDEPTTGLDNESRLKLVSNIKKYQAKTKALILMISHHPGEVVNSVDQFFHLKDGQLNRISTERMTELAEIKKIEFDGAADLQLPSSLKTEFSDGHYKVLSKKSDQWIVEAIEKKIQFHNLEIASLGGDQLMLEVL